MSPKGVRIVSEASLVDENCAIRFNGAEFELVALETGSVVATGSKAFRLSNYAFAHGANRVRHEYDGSRHEE